MTYYNWEFTKKSVSAEGGKHKKYIHYCPLADFKVIIESIVNVFEKAGIVSKADVTDMLEGRELTKGRVFTKKSQDYKIGMVFQFLFDNSLIYKSGFVYSEIARGNKRIGYKLDKSKDEILNFVDNYNSYTVKKQWNGSGKHVVHK